ncbi:MAG TPA: hypothetical protein DCE41_10320 [Cytophagales bacterium]|nr:hypothetical protein [Cytophagales bacterium]
MLALITLLDIIDHLTRDTDRFRNQSEQWILFSISSYLVMVVVIHWAQAFFNEKNRRLHELWAAVAIIIGALTHQLVTGPMLDQLIHGERTLRFLFNPATLVAGLVIYYIVYGVWYRVVGRRLKPRR